MNKCFEICKEYLNSANNYSKLESLSENQKAFNTLRLSQQDVGEPRRGSSRPRAQQQPRRDTFVVLSTSSLRPCPPCRCSFPNLKDLLRSLSTCHNLAWLPQLFAGSKCPWLSLPPVRSSTFSFLNIIFFLFSSSCFSSSSSSQLLLSSDSPSLLRLCDWKLCFIIFLLRSVIKLE